MDSIMSVNKEVNPQHKFALLPFPGKSKLCSLISWIGKKKSIHKIDKHYQGKGRHLARVSPRHKMFTYSYTYANTFLSLAPAQKASKSRFTHPHTSKHSTPKLHSIYLMCTGSSTPHICVLCLVSYSTTSITVSPSDFITARNNPVVKKYLLSCYKVPGAILGTGYLKVN